MTDSEHISFILDTLRSLDGDITPAQGKMFFDYYRFLSDAPINVTSIKDFDEVVIKHFYDSIFPAASIKNKNLQVMDVGSGGGFPGIPLAIMSPRTKFVLLETVRKKVDFLNGCIDKLGLKNVSTIWGRAEDIARDKTHRAQYDIALSRALAPMNILAEYTLPFLRIGGQLLSYKSSDYQEELAASEGALSTLGSNISSISIDNYELPQNMGLRAIISVTKLKDTPSKYPRKSGTPKKDPL